MAYTSHGYQIPNTPVEADGPPVARCGGPGICEQCSTEILHGLREQKAVKNPDVESPPPPQMRYEEKARLLVAQYVNARIGDDSAVDPLRLSDVFIVWHCKTLQNWKAICATNIPDGMLFEVTYDGNKGTTYLDAYVKWQNVAIPDGGIR